MGFESELTSECRKLIQRFEWYARELRDDDRRRSRRTGETVRGDIHRPSYWSVDDAFNPYKVNASLSSISRAVRIALREHDYTPYNPVEYQVPKLDGSLRTVSVFSVADSTVSRRVYRSLLYKNKSRLSSYSYAYRDDLTTHDAIQNITADLQSRGRIFLAEYDFSKYFDSISQEYVWRILDEKRFLLSQLERHVIERFLATTLQPQESYVRKNPEGETQTDEPKKGIPQGTSISLFLANVAAWELDRSLERLGVGFARYADDTIVWSYDYGRICEAVESLTQLGADIGAQINFKKSEGISIFAPTGAPVEFKPKPTVEFVGYRVAAAGKIGLRPSVVKRIKKRMSYLIWTNLLEPLRKGHFVAARVAPQVDRDYVVMILQLRRYLYGNLTEAKLRRLLDGRAKQIRYPGLMSFFPLVDDIEQLKSLDGWLHHTVYTSLRARTQLLKSRGVIFPPTPHGLSREALLTASGTTSADTAIDLRIPSFVRIGTAIQRAALAHGPNAVGRAGGPQHYDYM